MLKLSDIILIYYNYYRLMIKNIDITIFLKRWRWAEGVAK